MTRLNSDFLRHHRTTDVISFLLAGSKRAGLEGEVYVNLDQARRQAAEAGESFRRETARLVAHGTLHLMGDDDGTVRERAHMRRKEDLYIAAIH